MTILETGTGRKSSEWVLYFLINGSHKLIVLFRCNVIAENKGHHSLHAYDFEKLMDSLPQESVTEWKAMVEKWEEDNSNENPFQVNIKGVYLMLCCTCSIH
jgi:hypothetical protein